MPRFGLRSRSAPLICIVCDLWNRRRLLFLGWTCERCSPAPEPLKVYRATQPEERAQAQVRPEAELFAFAGFGMFEPKAPGVIRTTYRRAVDWGAGVYQRWTGASA